MGFFSQLALRLAPQLGMFLLVTVLAGSAFGWYHFNVTRPAERVKVLEKENADLKNNIKGKDTALKVFETNAAETRKLLDGVSKRCEKVFVSRREAVEAEEKRPGIKVEGHGPDVMNRFYLELYKGE